MKKRKYKKIVYPFLILILLSFLLFNEYGILRYFELRSEVSGLKKEILKTEKELIQLNLEIDSVKTSLYKIEKIARERYHMLDQNEQAIKIEGKENN